MDFPTIAQEALRQCEAVLSHWLPGGKREGSEYVVLNPTRADSSPGSFRINLNTGKWADFADSAKGGDLISLVAYLDGVSQTEAAKRLSDFLGMRDLAAPTAKEPTAKEITSETPKQAARRLAAAEISGGYKPEALHEYTDAKGEALHWRIRAKHPDTGDKWIRPMKLNGESYTLGEPEYPEGKPLFRLHALTRRPGDPVFVVEGEWAADHLMKLGVLATTSGAADSASKADWRSLAGRTVTIWPDNDDPGRRYAQEVAEKLLIQNCTVRVIDVAALNLPPKGDAVDWLAANPDATTADVLRLAAAPIPKRDEGTEGFNSSTARPELKPIPNAVNRATIEAAIAKLGDDVGSVFEADVVAALTAERERNPAEYQRYRKRIKDAGASVGELDRLVCASGGDGEEAAVKGRKIVLYQPEPWPEPVNGAEVLDEALAKIKRHMSILDEHAVAAVLWAAHAHVYDIYAHTPRLLINAPEADCGKTALLSHLVGNLVPRPQPLELMKPAPFFRLAEEHKPCFLIDEVDVFIKEDSELLAAINNGWEPQGGVARCVGEDFEVRIFSTHTPVAMAGVKLHKVFPGTTWSRSIVITLEKATEAEIDEHYDRRKHRAGLLEIGRKLARWCSDNANDLGRAEPALPGNAYNRRADKWRPLFAIAELAGGEWPNMARHAFLAEEQDAGVNVGAATDLLADIRDLLEPHEHVISTKGLIGRLCAPEESRWAEYNYRERDLDRRCISGRQLAGLLKDYKIKPGTVRLPDGSTPKGYRREDLERVFLHYLPPLLSATPPQPKPGAASGEIRSATNDQSVADRKTSKPAPHKDCGGVADREGGISQKEAWSELTEGKEEVLL